ncbi:MAG: ABC transporter permease [Clostridiales bacterium]|nr:ABC transporter permease [Clostridiales bacterium]
MDDLNVAVSKSSNARGKTSKLRMIVRRVDFSIGVGTVVLFLVFSLTADAFFTQYNQFNLLRTAGLTIFVALAQGMLQVTGGISLSIGAMGVFSGMFACMAMENLGAPIWLGFLIAVAVGMLCGLLTGLVIESFKLPGFVVTLAVQYILTGLVNGITKGYPFTHLPEEITYIGRKGYFGILPLVTIMAIVALAIVWYVFRYTAIGRRILATGGNSEAARLAGIPTSKLVVLSHMISGFFSGLAAMLWVSRAGSMQTTLGGDWMLLSISVSMLGAAKAGFVSPIGFFFSAILITMIKNGLVVANVNVYYENVFLGVIVLAAIALDSMRTAFNLRAKKL